MRSPPLCFSSLLFRPFFLGYIRPCCKSEKEYSIGKSSRAEPIVHIRTTYTYVEEDFFFTLPKSGVAPTFLPSKVIVITISHCLPLAFSSLTSLTSVAAKSRRRKRGGAGKKHRLLPCVRWWNFYPFCLPLPESTIYSRGRISKNPSSALPLFARSLSHSRDPDPPILLPPPPHTKKERNCFTGFPLMNTFFGGEGEISFL